MTHARDAALCNFLRPGDPRAKPDVWECDCDSQSQNKCACGSHQTYHTVCLGGTTGTVPHFVTLTSDHRMNFHFHFQQDICASSCLLFLWASRAHRFNLPMQLDRNPCTHRNLLPSAGSHGTSPHSYSLDPCEPQLIGNMRASGDRRRRKGCEIIDEAREEQDETRDAAHHKTPARNEHHITHPTLCPAPYSNIHATLAHAQRLQGRGNMSGIHSHEPR